MKKLTAIILLAVMTMFMMTGCKREGEMVETMISSIFSTENRSTENRTTESSGRVTDDDGYIGNEDQYSSETSGTMGNTSDSTGVLDSIL